MKTNYLLRMLLSILVFPGFLVAQHPLPDTLRFNFLTPDIWKNTLKAHKYGKSNSTIVVKISNINKNLWAVQDSTKQASYNTQMPDIFKGVKLPAFLNLGIPATTEQKMGHAPTSAIASLDALNNTLKVISNAKKEMFLSAVQLNNHFKKRYENCNDSFPEIEQLVIADVITITGINDRSRTGQSAGIRKYFQTLLNTAQQALADFDAQAPSYIAKEKNDINQNLIDVIWVWKNMPPDKKNPNFLTRGKEATKTEIENEEKLQQIQQLKTASEKAHEAVEEMEKFINDNKVEELIASYNLINESNFTYYGDKIKIKEDELSLNITMVPVKPLVCNSKSKLTIIADYPTKGGFKVDFSTGVFGMAGNKDFIGRDPYYQAVDSATSMIRDKDGGNRVLLGIGALMHLYLRSGGKTNWAISPGLSTTTSFDAINFHLGGSLITGGKNRIVFTLGVVARESKILDRQYDYDVNYAKSKLPEAPPTIKIFPRFGGFLSVTYNWSKLKAQ